MPCCRTWLVRLVQVLVQVHLAARRGGHQQTAPGNHSRGALIGSELFGGPRDHRQAAGRQLAKARASLTWERELLALTESCACAATVSIMTRSVAARSPHMLASAGNKFMICLLRLVSCFFGCL